MPTFSTVSSIPGIDTGAPERTDSSSGARALPEAQPGAALEAPPTAPLITSRSSVRRLGDAGRRVRQSRCQHRRLRYAQSGAHESRQTVRLGRRSPLASGIGTEASPST